MTITHDITETRPTVDWDKSAQEAARRLPRRCGDSVGRLSSEWGRICFTDAVPQ